MLGSVTCPVRNEGDAYFSIVNVIQFSRTLGLTIGARQDSVGSSMLMTGNWIAKQGGPLGESSHDRVVLRRVDQSSDGRTFGVPSFLTPPER